MELRVTYFILSRCVSKPWRRDIREMKNPWGIGQRDEHTPSEGLTFPSATVPGGQGGHGEQGNPPR
jgi:hypothetical protein